MTMEEAIKKREELLAEQRKFRQAIKILDSSSLPQNRGIQYAKAAYEETIKNIDFEIRQLAEEVERDKPVQQVKKDTGDCTSWTIEFDFEGVKTYPTRVDLRIMNAADKRNVLTWTDRDEAEAFARWYGYKHGYKIIPVSEVGK